ncbi:MAG: pseudouridine synthase [Bacteroidota bacterium]
MFSYFIIYKPFNMLSQFTREGSHATLADLEFTFPKDVYPVGRLDSDSEGLLLLTNDKKINALLLDPKQKHQRTYLVQAEGDITDKALLELQKGVEININGKTHKTLPAKAHKIPEPAEIPERNPPIRFRKSVPTSWIQLTLTEGKNRQVRRMTAKTGFPTLRLIRIQMEQLTLSPLKPGDVMELDRNTVYEKLGLKM